MEISSATQIIQQGDSTGSRDCYNCKDIKYNKDSYIGEEFTCDRDCNRYGDNKAVNTAIAVRK